MLVKQSTLTQLYALIFAGIVTPAAAGTQTVNESLNRLSAFLNQIIPFFFLLATIVFLWGVLKWIAAGTDEDKAAEGKSFIIRGIIGLAVMISVWGIVNILVTFFFPPGTDFNIPGPGEVPTQPTIPAPEE